MKPELPWLPFDGSTLRADEWSWDTRDGWHFEAHMDSSAEVCGLMLDPPEGYSSHGRCAASPRHEHPHIWMYQPWVVTSVSRGTSA